MTTTWSSCCAGRTPARRPRSGAATGTASCLWPSDRSGNLRRVSAWTWQRRAARVVLLDRQGRVLLLNNQDPADTSKHPWWEIPGGGVDPGETSEEAALRELHEETGIAAELGPCVWTQQTEYDFGGYHFQNDERIHVAWCDG